jgi:hypothetical protein
LLGHGSFHTFDENAYWRPSFALAQGISRRLNGQLSQTHENRALGTPQLRHFRNRQEKHKMTTKILTMVYDLLIQLGSMLKTRTVLDAN